MWHQKKTRRTYHCSFCNKTQDQVERLIAGPGGIYICDQCIDLCNQIIQEDRAKRQQASEPPRT